MFQVITILLS